MGTSYEDEDEDEEEEEHGVELVGDSLAPPPFLDLHQELVAEGEIPHHYSAVVSFSEGELVSYERAWHG